jgi:hypothetical protein
MPSSGCAPSWRRDLDATQRRLEAAEKARDTAIKTVEQAATRAATSRKPQR